MKFYDEWNFSLINIEENIKFTKRFLAKEECTIDIFKNGTPLELTSVCKFLLSIPITNFIYCIDSDIDCTSDMIIQYSNLNHALIDVTRVLKFSDNPLTFSELGKIIIKAKEDGACKKYGENHSKLAEELSMVSLKRYGSTEVANTAFGDFSVGLSDEDRLELVKRLVLRNEFIQKIIYHAKNGMVNYMELAMLSLSESTAIRRKSNVKQICYLILKDTDLFNNIVW